MEIFDLYDRDRRPLGKTIVRGADIPEGMFHIVIHICIFSPDGRMLIQQRTPFKDGWPDRWDVSVGGSAVSGENSAQAAHRELKEELGLDVSFEKEMPWITLPFSRGFDDIYCLEMDLDPEELVLQPEEVQAARWATLEEILDMIESGAFIPYHADLIRLLFAIRVKRGAHRA